MKLFQTYLLVEHLYELFLYHRTIYNTWQVHNISASGSILVFDDNYLITQTNDTLTGMDFYAPEINKHLWNVTNVKFSKADIFGRRILIQKPNNEIFVSSFNTSGVYHFADFIGKFDYNLTDKTSCLSNDKIFIIKGGKTHVYKFDYSLRQYVYDTEIFHFKNDASAIVCNEHFGFVKSSFGAYTLFTYKGDDLVIGAELYSGYNSSAIAYNNKLVIGDPQSGEFQIWVINEGDMLLEYIVDLEPNFLSFETNKTVGLIALDMGSGSFILYEGFELKQDNSCKIIVIVSISILSVIIVCFGIFLHVRYKRKQEDNKKMDENQSEIA